MSRVISVFRSSVRSHAVHAIGELKNERTLDKFVEQIHFYLFIHSIFQTMKEEVDSDPQMARAAVYYLLILEDQLVSRVRFIIL